MYGHRALLLVTTGLLGSCLGPTRDTDIDAGSAGDAAVADAATADAAAADTPAVDASSGSCAVTLGGSSSPLFEQPAGMFILGAYSSWAIFNGAVFDGPPIELHQESERRGLCRLLTHTGSICTPECDASQVCIDSECLIFPTARSVGAVTLSGVGSDVHVDPSGAGTYYWVTEEIGLSGIETVGVSAPGDIGPAFELSACATPPPAATSDWGQLLEARADGEDVTLRWSDPIGTSRIYLRMTTGIGTHGGISPVEIECEGRDTGSLTLPGDFLDALFAEGWSCGECGNNDLYRYHAAETSSGGHVVQLRAQSSTPFWFIPRSRG